MRSNTFIQVVHSSGVSHFKPQTTRPKTSHIRLLKNPFNTTDHEIYTPSFLLFRYAGFSAKP